jgi:hypothetical protein
MYVNAMQWVPETRYFNKHVPIFLLGLKGDLRCGSESRGGEKTGVVAREQVCIWNQISHSSVKLRLRKLAAVDAS